MKRIILLPILFFIALLSACEEVIDIELPNSESKYVIEANLTNNAGQASVLLSKTIGFDEASGFNGVAGARVTIKGDNLTETVLTQQRPGIYVHPRLRGVPGRNYILTVTVNGETFTAESKMPVLVTLDSLYVQDLKLFDGVKKYTYVKFTDPKGLGNYYRFKEYKNRVYSTRINVMNDNLIDGNTVNQLLRGRGAGDADDDDLKVGDTIRVDFQSLDEATYKYWFSARGGASNGGSNATPVNPVSNIKGGAIGYFSAHTQNTQQLVVR